MGDDELLRELHDSYAWEVNAAVGEGRLELVWQLADEYLDQAMRLMTEGGSAGCGREHCAVCQQPRPAARSRSRSRFRGWFRGWFR